jgi:hypothetical protein
VTLSSSYFLKFDYVIHYLNGRLNRLLTSEIYSLMLASQSQNRPGPHVFLALFLRRKYRIEKIIPSRKVAASHPKARYFVLSVYVIVGLGILLEFMGTFTVSKAVVSAIQHVLCSWSQHDENDPRFVAKRAIYLLFPSMV